MKAPSGTGVMRAFTTAVVAVLVIAGSATGGLLSRVSVASPGGAAVPMAGLGRVAISADGRYVAFRPFVKRDATEPAGIALSIRDRKTGASRPVDTGNPNDVVYPAEAA